MSRGIRAVKEKKVSLLQGLGAKSGRFISFTAWDSSNKRLTTARGWLCKSSRQKYPNGGKAGFLSPPKVTHHRFDKNFSVQEMFPRCGHETMHKMSGIMLTGKRGATSAVPGFCG